MTALANPIPVTGAGVVMATPCSYRGLSIRDTSGATNTVTLYDNASAASGTVLFSYVLAANAAVPPENVPDGVRCANGLYLNTTGAVVGSVRVG